MEITETDFARTPPVLAGPVPPEAPLPFFEYVRTVRDNAIAGFHEDVFRQWIVETRVWRLHTFIVNDLAGIKRMLLDNADNYIKGNIEQRITGTWHANDFIASDRGDWRERRRTMSSSLDYRSIPGNSAIILDAAQSLLIRWNSLPRGTVLEACAEMTQMTLEIISRICFSSDGIEMADIMRRASQRYQVEEIFDLLDFVPVFDRLWGGYKRYKRRGIFREMDGSVDRLITRRSREKTNSYDDTLARLMAEKDAATGIGLSAQEIHGQLITVIGAGHESTALTLTWIWYLLSQHPVHEAKLHAELDAVLADRPPTPEDLAKLTYTRMIIEETLRLYPPFHTMAWRGVVADDEICGVKIPKGSTVTIVPWVLHRHAGLWEHPERFDPERFLPERSAGRSRFIYLPFGIGPRVCIGASFAMTELMLILATIAQRYRLRLVPDHKVEAQALVSLRARYGLKVTLESRDLASKAAIPQS